MAIVRRSACHPFRTQVYLCQSFSGLTMNDVDISLQAAIVKSQHARRRRDMRWCDYVGTAFLAAACTVVLMLCIS
jgi:hypothetical protein